MPLIQDDDGGYLEIRGRGFLFYVNSEGKEYQVDSEMVASDEYDIAVYALDVSLVGEGTRVTEPERVEIISRVIKLCKKGNVRIEVVECRELPKGAEAVVAGGSPSSHAIKDCALKVIIREKYRYRGYESRQKSLDAFRRMCPGVHKKVRMRMLDSAVAMYAEAERLVLAHPSISPTTTAEPATSEALFTRVRAELQKQFPGFPLEVCGTAINWGIYWQLLR